MESKTYDGTVELTQAAMDTMYRFGARMIVHAISATDDPIAKRYAMTQDVVAQLEEEMGDKFQPYVLNAWIEDMERDQREVAVMGGQ